MQELNPRHWHLLRPSSGSMLASVLALCPEGTRGPKTVFMLQFMITEGEGAPPKALGGKSPGGMAGRAWILGLVLWLVGISPLEPHCMLSLREKGFITK